MLVSFVGKTCTFLRLFPALNRRLKNASPASCDALRITFSVTLFCAPNERLDPKDHRLLVIKNPPRFFFAQPPSRTRRSQLSRAHTHTFTRPSLSESTLTSNRFLAARALSAASPRISACTFCFGLNLHSAHLLNQSPGLSPFSFRKNEPPSSGRRLSQVSRSLRLHDCSLHLPDCLRLPASSFWGSMFQSNSHKPDKLHHDSMPYGYNLASPPDAPHWVQLQA